MDTFQRNTIKSFRKVREDMRNLQAQITDLNKRLEEAVDKIKECKSDGPRRKR